MKDVYLVYTFGHTGETEPETDDYSETGRTRPVSGTVLTVAWDDLEAAKADAVGRFRAEPEKDNSPWIKEAVAWAYSRDPARANRLYLWSALPAAAPAMDDPNQDFYPQMRETFWYIVPLTVREKR